MLPLLIFKQEEKPVGRNCVLPKTGCDLWSSVTAVVMQCVPEGLPEGQEDLLTTEQIPCASRQRTRDKTDPPGMKAME